MTEEIYYICFSILYGFLSLIVIVFSSITLLTIIFHWRIHFRSISNLLICNSSIVLLIYALSCFIQIPFIFINHYQFCQLRAFLTIYSACTQVYTYLSQAIFHYFSIVYYQKRILLGFRLNIFIMILGWIIPLILTSIVFTIPYAYQYESETGLCFLTTKIFISSAFIAAAVLLLPLSIIISLYGRILWKLKYHYRHQNIQSNNIVLIRYKRNLKVFNHIMIHIGIIFICGTPYTVSMLMNLISKSPWIFYMITVLFISLSMALQSIVSFWTTPKVKRIFYENIHFTHRNQVLPIIN